MPLSEENIRSAVKLHSIGSKLDISMIKLLNLAVLKYGEVFCDIMLNFIEKGYVIDIDFPDFFFNLNSIYKKIIKNKSEKKNILNLIDIFNEKKSGEERILDNVFYKYFGEESSFKTYNVFYEGKDLIIQQRISNENDSRKFYFNIDNEEFGKVLIVIDLQKMECLVNVFINKNLYNEYLNKKIDYEILNKKIGRLLPDKRVSLRICELKNQFLFWQKEDLFQIKDDFSGIFNIDISV